MMISFLFNNIEISHIPPNNIPLNMSLKRTTLTEIQKRELCIYARDNKRTRAQYVDWIEKEWHVRVNESTITCILQTTEK
jgi:hypothetical protein